MKTTGLIFAGEKSLYTEPHATTFYDVSQFGNDGTITGATWLKLPSGLWVTSFDGSSYIDFGDQVSFEGDNVSVGCWFKKSASTGWRQLINKWDSPNKNGYVLAFNGQSLEALVGNGSVTTPTGNCAFTISDDILYHALMTYDGTTLTLYVNGVSKNTDTTVSGNLSYGSESFQLGKYSVAGANYFIGLMGLEKLYSYALTASEVFNIFQQERKLFGV